MFRFIDRTPQVRRLATSSIVIAGLLSAFTFSTAQAADATKFAGVGRSATPAEIKAWDIDVRPDFKGLPKGRGTVSQGQDVWEDKCASCHGVFGESNEVFTPIAGGTSKQDIETGHVANLMRRDFPQRTTLMKVATVSTLWDYINRAMPWTAPKSLKTDEVYAVVAYIMNLGGIVADDFELSDQNIAQVQARMPNRNGMTLAHGMWTLNGKPDVKNTACMSNCATELTVGSVLPDYARTAHGNLAEQNRVVGQVRGVDSSVTSKSATPAPAAAKGGPSDLLKSNNCTACHAQSSKVVGPSWADIAAKYKGDAGAAERLAAKVKQGGSGVWGAVPMPAHPQVPEADIKAMTQWVLTGTN